MNRRTLKTSKHLSLCLIGLAGLGVFFILLLIMAGVPKRAGRLTYRDMRMSMGTVVEIAVCYPRTKKEDLEEAIELVWSRIDDISWRMYGRNEGSDVFRLNNAAGRPVKIGPDTYRLLEDVREFSRRTGGSFDITVMPAMEIWREAQNRNRMPEAGQLEKLRAGIGMENLEFQPDGFVRMKNPGTMIDLGGVAKGFAVDEAASILRGKGFNDFLIDAGGDIYAGGMNCRDDLWRIGIRDPRETERILTVVRVSDQAVATSGDYEQHFEVEGQRFSHILDPRKAYPLKAGISATAIAPTAVEADVWATALCVLGPSEGLELIGREGEGFAGFIIEGSAASPFRIHRCAKFDSLVDEKYEVPAADQQ